MAPRTNLQHLDAAENVFFQRELEHILAESFDVKYTQLKGLLYVPVYSAIDPADETVIYEQYDSFGKAKRISDYSDDLPMVNVKGVQFSQRMQDYGAAFGYSIDEIRKASKTGKPLDRMRAAAAKKTLDLQLDDVIATGDSVADLKGFLNLASPLTYTLADGAIGGGTPKAWSGKTADEIIADLSGICEYVVTQTKEVERPTRILLPTAQFELINRKPRSTTSDTTVKSFFEGTHPNVQIMSWERLAGAGAASADRMVAYDPNPLNLRLLLSIAFEQMPPQQVNMSYKVNCRIKTGGVIAPYPKSICYADAL